MGHLTQADPAKTEFAVVASWTTAELAAIPMLDFEFGSRERLEKLRFRGHGE